MRMHFLTMTSRKYKSIYYKQSIRQGYTGYSSAFLLTFRSCLKFICYLCRLQAYARAYAQVGHWAKDA